MMHVRSWNLFFLSLQPETKVCATTYGSHVLTLKILKCMIRKAAGMKSSCARKKHARVREGGRKGD